ncbi:phage portal protein [Fodinicurvata sp. EGI_FJ10296]|uniref:phage portal protein n=1 Tax=Fodinicurvata sp. EGI_FJ10296 TaxID=3231908 RepID=UPI003453AA45
MTARTARTRVRIKGTKLYLNPSQTTPTQAATRTAPVRLAATASYQTTAGGPRARRWQPGAAGPNSVADEGLSQLRDQARDLSRRNALASTALDRLVDNVVGTGIKPQLRGSIQDLWLRWTDAADAAGQLDFYGLQAQAYRAIAEAGEVFVLLHPDPGAPVPLTLQLVEAEHCPLHLNRLEGGDRIIRQGIEFDPRIPTRRTAYWLYPRHPGDGDMTTAPAEPQRIPADRVLHLYWPTRPGQLRGEPALSRVLDLISDVADYNRAELTRKKTAALLVGFVRRNMPDGMSVEDLKESWGDVAMEDDAGDDRAHIDMEPGTMQLLAPGEEVSFADTTDVGSNYDPFMRHLLRSISGGAGVLYEQLSGDFSQINDRTWRAAVNEFRRHCEILQHHLMVFQFCRPVWQRFALLAQALGRAPAGSDASAPVKWTPQAWPYIHPVQDVEAKREEVRAGLASRTGVVSDRGEDSEVIDREIAIDNARADRLGLVHDSDGRYPRGGGRAGAMAHTPTSSTGPDTPNNGDDNADPD